MVHASHPMSLRVAYYKTWMVAWRPEDREATLSEAYMKVIEGLKENMKEEAREQAIEANLTAGDVSWRNFLGWELSDCSKRHISDNGGGLADSNGQMVKEAGVTALIGRRASENDEKMPPGRSPLNHLKPWSRCSSSCSPL